MNLKPIIYCTLLILICLPCKNLQAQYANPNYLVSLRDSSNTQSLDMPTKTLIKSAIIPGWGQLSNKQYYKIPIVWAGMGFALYSVSFNSGKYSDFRQAYIWRTDEDPATIDIYDPVDGSNDIRYNETQLIKIRDAYRRNMELSVLSTLGVYALNIIDAYVSAHLLDFDLDDNLGLNPLIIYNFAGQKITMASLNINF